MKKLHQELLALLDETNAIKVLDLVSDWVRLQRTCAMIMQKDGLCVHLVSKRDMLDDLKDAFDRLETSKCSILSIGGTPTK